MPRRVVDPVIAPPERRISLPFEVYALNTRLGAFLDVALAGTGLRPAEYALYSLMLEAGPRTPSALADALGVPPTTLSGYLSAMVERGDANRIPNPADGRSALIVLTDRGRAVHRDVQPAFRAAGDAITANLSAPEAEVRAALAAIAEAIDRAAGTLEPPGPPRTLADTTTS
jgi:DNA-binding MarR family transcriptional regulator